MKKRLVSLLSLVLALVLLAGTVSALYAPTQESWQHFSALDAETILRDGIYSEDGETVTWNEMTFIVGDLRRLSWHVAEINRSNLVIQRAGEEYRLVSSSVFYSKGAQHVLGRITFNPGQTGAFQTGVSFGIETTVSGGVNLDIFEANVSAGYSQTYTLGTTIDVENTSNYLRTVALGSVFWVYQYDVYDSSGNYEGRGTVYEPYSVYTYWVN